MLLENRGSLYDRNTCYVIRKGTVEQGSCSLSLGVCSQSTDIFDVGVENETIEENIELACRD